MTLCDTGTAVNARHPIIMIVIEEQTSVVAEWSVIYDGRFLVFLIAMIIRGEQKPDADVHFTI